MSKEDDVRDDVPGRKVGRAKSKDEQIKGEKWRERRPKKEKDSKREQRNVKECKGL